MKSRIVCQRLESRLLLAAGELNPSFGNQGAASVNLRAQWNAIAALPDGGFVVAGNTFKSGGSSVKNGRDAAIIVARYSADGTLDTSFGSAGIATFDFGSGADEAEHVMVRSDGRIVIGGKCNGIESTIRITTSGALDTTFAKKGILSGFMASIMQPDGDLLGMSGSEVQRRSPKAGLLDTTFGNAGSVNFEPSVPEIHASTPDQIFLQADGKIILGALFDSMNGEQTYLGITRLLPNGQTDTSFGTDGTYSSEFLGYQFSMALSPNGNILVASSNIEASQLIEVSSTGSLVNSFSPAIDSNDPITGITVNPDGKIDLLYVDVGEVGQVLQLMPDGSTDIRFDGGNRATLPNVGFAMATQDNSHLLVAGYSDSNGPGVYQMVTEAANQPIVRYPNGDRVVIYGTTSADQIKATRTSTAFKFSLNGISQTYQLANVKSILVYADAGNDSISIDGHGTNIAVYAGDGNDTVTILSGNEAFVDGGNGNDSISGAGIDPKDSGGLYAFGDAGNDHIIGSRFDDNIEGDSGNDTLDGDGNMNDGLFGGSGNDLLLHTGYATRGQAGNDTLVGIGDGGPGNDTYFIRDGKHETIGDDEGQNFAQIDDSAKVKDMLNGNFTLIP